MTRGALLLVMLAACEPHAKASDPQVGVSGPPEVMSKEYETCAATAECSEGLRCIDATCQRAQRSRLGDFDVALANAHSAKGDLPRAVAAYAEALGAYTAEQLEAPAPVDCAYGHTLVAASLESKDDTARTFGESAARVLHRCLLAAPQGSRLAAGALADAAQLADLGLDAKLFSGPKLLDVYLTQPPAGPSTAKLVVSVVATPAPAAKSYPQLADAISSSVLRPQLVACWKPTKSLAVTLPIKVAFVESGDYEGEGHYAGRIDGTAVDATETCVRTALEPVIKAMKFTDSFATRLAITIQ